MKIKKRTKINRRVLAIAAAVLICTVAFLTYTFALKPQGNGSSKTTDSSEMTSDRQQSDNLKNDPDNKETAPNSDTPASPTVNSESKKKQVQMVASTDQSDGTVFIRGGVNYPVSGGGCYVQLSGPSGQSRRIDSALLSNPASADCKTISIPATELTSGKWTFTLHYVSDEYEGVSNEISFTL